MTGAISWKSEFLSLSRRFARRIAVVDRDGSITYRDLFAHAAGIGAAVRASGAAPGEPVGTFLPNGRGAVAACLGVTLAGVADARLNVALSAGDLAHCMETAGVRTVVTNAELAPAVTRLGARVIEIESRRAGRPRRLRFSGRRRRQLGLPHLHLRHDRAPQGHRALAGRTLDGQRAAALGPAACAGCRRQPAAGDAVLAWRRADDACLSRRRGDAHPAAGRRCGARAGPDREARGQPGVRPADRARQAAGVCRRQTIPGARDHLHGHISPQRRALPPRQARVRPDHTRHLRQVGGVEPDHGAGARRDRCLVWRVRRAPVDLRGLAGRRRRAGDRPGRGRRAGCTGGSWRRRGADQGAAHGDRPCCRWALRCRPAGRFPRHRRPRLHRRRGPPASLRTPRRRHQERRLPPPARGDRGAPARGHRTGRDRHHQPAVRLLGRDRHGGRRRRRAAGTG